MSVTVPCYFGCGREVDPSNRMAWHRITGWERMSSKSSARRGGSDISMRERTGEYACDECIRRVKAGLSPLQEGMF
ncbi:MAG TPA: hypothetical protein VLA89_10215 [Gemmatimonadales bacterium]|nr:hypothetical protein [Gemmatimonadales bacterium]